MEAFLLEAIFLEAFLLEAFFLEAFFLVGLFLDTPIYQRFNFNQSFIKKKVANSLDM